jgi:hypothetical protein
MQHPNPNQTTDGKALEAARAEFEAARSRCQEAIADVSRAIQAQHAADAAASEALEALLLALMTDEQRAAYHALDGELADARRHLAEYEGEDMRKLAGPAWRAGARARREQIAELEDKLAGLRLAAHRALDESEAA